ncbi:hypothetical protein EDE15_3527 [Edaphobacter aggregans]|uniref:Uncharacterized protein n=1 Tax=Edaphobacter aggregans TaxID=570835 RepID=A0A428MM54_9BACT|nr:hypothetical protein EDE15_3527 [Edaphobacter aggregans]
MSSYAGRRWIPPDQTPKTANNCTLSPGVAVKLNPSDLTSEPAPRQNSFRRQFLGSELVEGRIAEAVVEPGLNKAIVVDPFK